jgi:hypothetical protein
MSIGGIEDAKKKGHQGVPFSEFALEAIATRSIRTT